ncbi:MAG TPA: hypothetical protein VMB80_06010 [Candidatus Acidoferrum sp.]|nr:hypothetical protein [Candidatus Acidoferrum sp.]
MKKKASPAGTTRPNALTGHLRTACLARLLPLALLLAQTAVIKAQFDFITNNGAITITGYTGSGGDVAIPGATNGYPVTVIGDHAFTGLYSLTPWTTAASMPIAIAA